MFYSNSLLNIRGGKLGIAWLAATNRLGSITKKGKYFRHIMQTDVYRVCEDILVHIQARGIENVPRRFSLYLSSMLMSGTVKIYRMQVKFLLSSVSDVFVNLQGKIALIRDLDSSTSKGKVLVCEEMVQMHSCSTFFGHPILEFDHPEVGLMVSSETDPVSFVTPRKKGSAPVQRDFEVSNLLQEWELDSDLRFPNVARKEEITIIEEASLHHPLPIITPAPGPLQEDLIDTHFGPPPDDFLNGIPLYQDAQTTSEPTPKKVRPQPPSADLTRQLAPVSEEIIEEFPFRIEPQETPAQPPAPKTHPPLRSEKKPVKPPMEETMKLDDGPKAAQKRTEDEMILETVEEGMRPKFVSRKKRHTALDAEIKIDEGVMKRQVQHYGDTMRERTAAQDVINVSWWRLMKPAHHLLQKTHRLAVNPQLKKLITRNYVANPWEGRFDGYATTKRKVQYPDVDMAERARLSEQEELSTLSQLSSIHQDASKRSSIDKSASLLETPAAIPPAVSDVAPLLSIPEERVGESPIPRGLPEPDATPSEAVDVPRAPRPTVLFPREKTRDEGVLSVTAGVEEEELPSALQLLKEGEERRGRKRTTSPDAGFTMMTVQADIHVEEPAPFVRISVPEGEALSGIPPKKKRGVKEVLPLELRDSSVLLPPQVDASTYSTPAGPHLPRGPLAPSDLSPVGRPRLSRVIMTPDPRGQREASVIEHIRVHKTTTFEKLLPPNPTRRDAACTFAAILELHKKLKVRLNQEVAYGTITVHYVE